MAIDTQVLYLGRWVPRENFRVYVYSATGKKLLNSYSEYVEHLATGIWHSQPDLVPCGGEKVVVIGRNSGRNRRRKDDGGKA